MTNFSVRATRQSLPSHTNTDNLWVVAGDKLSFVFHFCFPDTMTYHELADEIRLDLLKMNRSDMADVLDLKAPLILISFFQLHFQCDQ